MKTVRIEQFKKAFENGKSEIKGTFAGKAVAFSFGKSKTGFGYRHYFICPSCGRYRAILTFDGVGFICFKCAGVNPYAGVQTATRGGDVFIGYKMERYAQKHGVKGFHYPFKYYEYERPKRYRRERWDNAMKVLQALESMRNQSIFFGKIWDAKTIQSIEKGTNEYLQLPAPLHLNQFHPYDGKPVHMGMLQI